MSNCETPTNIIHIYTMYSISLCIPSRVVIQPNNSTQKRKHFSYFNSFQNNLYVELTFPIMCPQITIHIQVYIRIPYKTIKLKKQKRKTFILSWQFPVVGSWGEYFGEVFLLYIRTYCESVCMCSKIYISFNIVGCCGNVCFLFGGTIHTYI